MIGEESKIEKSEPTKEITPTTEAKEEKFDAEKYEERVEEYQGVRQELEKEGQEKDLQLFGEFKEKYSSDLDPEVFERTEEYLKEEKYESGKEETSEEKAEEKTEKDKEPEIDEELKEHFKNRFLELLKEQVEKVEELKRKGEPFFEEVPAEEINYLIANKAFENLADDPKMPKEESMWLKAVLMGINVERAFIKEDLSDARKEHFELGPHTFLMNGLGVIFPKDAIKQLESIVDEKMTPPKDTDKKPEFKKGRFSPETGEFEEAKDKELLSPEEAAVETNDDDEKEEPEEKPKVSSGEKKEGSLEEPTYKKEAVEELKEEIKEKGKKLPEEFEEYEEHIEENPEKEKEKEKILKAVKKVYTDAQEAKKKIESGEITEDKAKKRAKEKAISNPYIAEYLSAQVNKIVNIAFKSKTERECLGILTEKYRDEVEEKLDKKFPPKKRKELKKKESIEKEEAAKEIETEEAPKPEVETEET